MRGFEASGLVLHCTIERTPRCDRTTRFREGVRSDPVQLTVTKGHPRVRTPSMDLLRKNVFAGAALAGEEDGRVAGGGALRLLQQSLHDSDVRFEQRKRRRQRNEG